MAAVRFLLGIFESGMLPGIAYCRLSKFPGFTGFTFDKYLHPSPDLSRWYRRSELAFRLALYVVAAPLAGAFGGLLASGI
jgi:hypothetical protein